MCNSDYKGNQLIFNIELFRNIRLTLFLDSSDDVKNNANMTCETLPHFIKKKVILGTN
ncbi:hypothetical protein J2W48_003326 [Flavobacterium piscis]|uniref:Uncharacterized protein n=1 Tax=Flavobacterium piscis TaxID=1114874 RepID=A0ABU1YAV8_9FLAO|nr:hypothetical protein [Flavobacterium piscis]